MAPRDKTQNRAASRSAARLAAGKLPRILLPSEAELLEDIARGMRIVGRPQSGFDISERGGKAGKIRFLRQVAHHGPGLHEDGSPVRLYQACRDF